MGICRGTSTRFQYCGKNIPRFGTYPNVCGASPAVFNPNVPKDSGVAMARAKSRRVVGRSAAKLAPNVNSDQVAGGIATRLEVNTYNGVKGQKSSCAASRSGGVGKMFGHGRAKRCFNTGCVCGDSLTDIPGNFSGRTADSSDVTTARASQAYEINEADIPQFEAEDGSLVGNQGRDLGEHVIPTTARCGVPPQGGMGSPNGPTIPPRGPFHSAQCRSGDGVCVVQQPDSFFQAGAAAGAGACTIYFDNTFFTPAGGAFRNDDWAGATTITITSGLKSATVNTLTLKACEPGAGCTEPGVSHGTITASTGDFLLTDNLSYTPDAGAGNFSDLFGGAVNFTATGLALINSCP